MKKNHYFMFEKDILRNYFQKDLGVLRDDFWGFWVSKWRPDAMLALGLCIFSTLIMLFFTTGGIRGRSVMWLPRAGHGRFVDLASGLRSNLGTIPLRYCKLCWESLLISKTDHQSVREIDDQFLIGDVFARTCRDTSNRWSMFITYLRIGI